MVIGAIKRSRRGPRRRFAWRCYQTTVLLGDFRILLGRVLGKTTQIGKTTGDKDRLSHLHMHMHLHMDMLRKSQQVV